MTEQEQQNIETEPQKTISVSFLELEVTRTKEKINDWFPKLEKKVGRSLPKFSRLEGGIYPDKDGTMHCWPGPHYYICVPTDAKPLLFEYGTYSYSIDKEVDDAMFNDKHSIFYWGPGCKPRLEPKSDKRNNPIGGGYGVYDGDY